MKIHSPDVLLLNNTGNKPKKMLIDSFVIREKEFEQILNGIVSAAQPRDVKNTLIIAQRGAGKTTLLHRLKYAFEDDAALSSRYVPIVFKEEQYHLSDLATLWESTVQQLDEAYNLPELLFRIDQITERPSFDQAQLLEVIQEEMQKQKRCILLFFENLNVFLGKLSDGERAALKEVLVERDYIRIIASSTSYADSKVNFSSDFFSFFETVSLNGLAREECERLLLNISSFYGYEDRIRHIIETQPSRIESLRRLTGGVPRTIAYLFQIFLDNGNGKAIKDLYLLVDTLTFLYKAELDQLSAQQQKVIDVIARNWDAIAVKEIAKKTRLESKNISTVLAGLEKNQLIEVVKTNTKNNLYRIKERFLNIWYLMRFGRKHDKNNVVWLVRFFDAWCDETELAKQVQDHIKQLSQGRYDEEAAVDMGNMFLSCKNVSQSMKLELLEATKSVLSERLSKKLQPSNKLLYDVFQGYLQNGEYDRAIAELDKIALPEIQRLSLLAYAYQIKKDYSKSVEIARRVLDLDPENASAALTLGIIHEENLRDIDQAKHFYEVAVNAKQMHPYAASRLADLVYRFDRNVERARELHQRAIRKGFKRSSLNLGKILRIEEEYGEALEYLNIAKEQNIEGVYLELAKLHADQFQNKKAVKYFEKSVAQNEPDALINFGSWYRFKSRPNYDKAIDLLEKAIAQGEVDAFHILGELYYEDLNNEAKAMAILSEGIDKMDADSAHSLAHLYLDKEEVDQAIHYFLKSFDYGRKGALFCMAEGLFTLGHNDKRQLVLDELQKHRGDLEGHVFFDILFSKILLWNDKVELSLEEFKKSVVTTIPEIIEEGDSPGQAELHPFIRQLSAYFILLMAKGYFKEAYALFDGQVGAQLKTVLKPIFYALMGNMKGEFPIEYLKAGDELTDTVSEIENQVKRLKKRLKI